LEVAAMMNSLLNRLRSILAAAIMLTIPSYAIYSLATTAAPRIGNVSLMASDDPIGNGLRIVHRSVRTQTPDAATNGDGAQSVELIDWVFTGKGNPSQYQ
jgi:hypothetical protein